LLGSRKINLWFFKTQEEIKTSHEFPVAFALNNGQFETVVSADDGGFIAVWDIEDGKLMSKFGNTHGPKKKITAGCFDSKQLRLATAGSDGTVKLWNFSNGQCLTEMTSKASSKEEKKKKKEKAGGKFTQEKNDTRKKPADEEKNAKRVDTEVTQMCCVFDPLDTEGLKTPYFISVGWDKKIHVWADEKDEVVASTKILPQNDQTGHKDDIMSAVFCNANNLIYTGGHDGTLIAWNFETGYSKHYLHEKDETCTSKDYIKEGKSVDQLLILEERKKLLSMSADQHLRFWNLDDLTSDKQPSFKFYCDHPKDDGLSAVAVDKTNNILLTGDTSG